MYYAGSDEMLRGEGHSGQGLGNREMRETRIAADLVASKALIGYGSSAFVTDWALLGIKPIRRDAEHIVALDADAVDDRAYDGARLHWLV